MKKSNRNLFQYKNKQDFNWEIKVNMETFQEKYPVGEDLFVAPATAGAEANVSVTNVEINSAKITFRAQPHISFLNTLF